MQNKVYIHVAIMNTWRAILSETLETIRISRLIDNASITLVAVGGALSQDDLDIHHSNIRIVNTDKPLHEFEYPTLDLLYQELEDDTKICYCHLKGVSQPNSLGHRAWRRDLIDFTILDWGARVLHLDVRHTSGPRVTGGGAGNGADHVTAYKHYSGNFWWARSDYLKKLPPPLNFRTIYPNRYAAEAWIGQLPYVNEFLL